MYLFLSSLLNRPPCQSSFPAAPGLPSDHYLLWLTRWDGVHFIDESFRALGLMILQWSVVRHPTAIPGGTVTDQFQISFITKGKLTKPAIQESAEDDLEGEATIGKDNLSHTAQNLSIWSIDILWFEYFLISLNYWVTIILPPPICKISIIQFEVNESPVMHSRRPVVSQWNVNKSATSTSTISI